MTERKILGLFSSLWLLVSCMHSSHTTKPDVSLEDKDYYEELFRSLPKPYALTEAQAELVIYKFYSPWCQSCLEELANLQNFVNKKGSQCKVFLFSIENVSGGLVQNGIQVHYMEGLFEKTKYQQVPLTFVFRNKLLLGKYTMPIDYSDGFRH